MYSANFSGKFDIVRQTLTTVKKNLAADHRPSFRKKADAGAIRIRFLNAVALQLKLDKQNSTRSDTFFCERYSKISVIT